MLICGVEWVHFCGILLLRWGKISFRDPSSVFFPTFLHNLGVHYGTDSCKILGGDIVEWYVWMLFCGGEWGHFHDVLLLRWGKIGFRDLSSIFSPPILHSLQVCYGRDSCKIWEGNIVEWCVWMLFCGVEWGLVCGILFLWWGELMRITPCCLLHLHSHRNRYVRDFSKAFDENNVYS